MKSIASCQTLLLLSASFALFSTPARITAQQPMLSSGSASVTSMVARTKPDKFGPFSHIAFGGGISPLGINMQVAMNASRHINVRGVGNLFNYTVNNFSTNGLNIDGKLNFATAGASVDYYPFANHGFRLSPGVLLYNQNNVAADITVSGGTSFTLNDVTYYASSTDPIKGNGGLALNTRKDAFSMTTGWGNMIPRRGKHGSLGSEGGGGHWSFPFEIGAAFVGAPTLNLALTSGQACDAQGQNCVYVASDSNVQANLQSQLTKYRNDLSPFQYYPIVSFGAAYSIRLRK